MSNDPRNAEFQFLDFAPAKRNPRPADDAKTTALRPFAHAQSEDCMSRATNLGKVTRIRPTPYAKFHAAKRVKPADPDWFNVVLILVIGATLVAAIFGDSLAGRW